MSSLDRDLEWDRRALDFARHVAGWSKDPSTKVGAVILDEGHHVVAIGYNGFPADVADTDERLCDRDMRLALTIHAELNAILNAKGKVSRSCTLYTSVPPCVACAAVIIQAGIRRVVSLPPPAGYEDRWAASCRTAREIFIEAGVTFTLFMGEV